MPMKCDRLLNDALNLHIDPEARAALNAMRKPAVSGYTPKEGIGIDINSKLITALNKIKKTHTKSIDDDVMFREETLRKLLEREGVSKAEINLSLDKAFKFLKENTILKADKVSIDTIRGAAKANSLQIKPISKDKYANITYNLQGIDNPSYEVRGLVMPNSRAGGAPGHFPGENGLIGWSRSYIGTQPGIEGNVLRLDEFQSDWAQDPELLKDLGKLPIDHNDFKKLMIVDAIDRAMKNSLDTIVIPITRTSNGLVGTEAVSKNYADLQKGILPKIRQELDRAGLKLDVKKVETKSEEIPIDIDIFRTFLDELEIKQEKIDKFINTVELRAAYDGVPYSKPLLYNSLESMDNLFTPVEDELIFQAIKDLPEQSGSTEALILKISDKSGKSLKPLENTVDLSRFKERLSKIDTIPEKTKRAISWYLDNANKEGPDKVLRTYNEWKGKYKTLPDISTLNMPTKYRWDALSVATTLGLGEAYSKLQEGES